MKKDNAKKHIIVGTIVMFSALAISIPSVILIRNRNNKDIKEVPTTVTASIEEEKDVDIGENNTSETVSEKKDNTTEKADKTDTEKDTSTEKTDTGNKKDNKTTEMASNKTDKTTERNDGQTNNSNNTNDTSTVASASNNNPVTTTESPKPTTTEAPKPSTTEATTEKAKVWHEPVYEQVWIVDEEAWDEPVSEWRNICNQCGTDFTGMTFGEHCDITDAIFGFGYCGGYTSKYIVTHYIHHDEIGHYEDKLVKEGYWE